MAANFAKPTVASSYTLFPDEIRASVDAALQQLSTELIPSGQSNTNIPNGAIKWDHQNNKWVKKVNGSFNSHLSDTYNFTNVEATQLDLGDNQQARFGNSQDLLIFHSGNNSHIRDTGTGNLLIQGSQVNIQSVNGGENMAQFTVNGAATLFHNNNTRIVTTSSGVTVTGSITTSGQAAIGTNITTDGSGGVGDRLIRVGAGRTGNGSSFLDLVGDSTYTTYGARLIRAAAGANANTSLLHRGTGELRISAQEAGKIALNTNGNTRLFINQTGQVSIGSTNPQKLFEVASAGTPEMIIRTSAGSSHDAILRLRGSRTNGLTDINQFIFETNDTGSNNYAAGSRLGSIICGKQHSNTTRGFFDFRLNNNSITDGTLGTSDVSKMYIKPSNEVGIGTTNPQRLLELSSADQTSIIRLHSTDTTIQTNDRIGMIEFSGNDTDNSGIAAFIEAVATNNIGQAGLKFGTGGAGSAAEKMRLDGAGRLIFGRTTQFNSRIGTTGVQPIIQVHSDSDSSISITRYSNNSGQGGRLFIQKARGTIASPLVVADNDITGEVRFSGYDGTHFANGCTILNRVNGTVSTNTLPSDLEFYIRDSTGASQELLTLNHDRFVGINKASPGVALHVRQLTDNAGCLRLEDSGNNTRYFEIDVTDNITKFSARNNTGGGNFTFVGTNNSTELEYLRILNGGGVSIGSSTMQTSGTTGDRLSVTGGNISTNSSIVAGRASGSIGLTINDGYGNSNLTFNHVNGKPDQNGNAARIEVNTDSNTDAVMMFELKGGVQQGTAVTLTNVLTLSEASVKAHKNIIPSSDSAIDIGTNSVRFANGYFDTLYGDASNLTNFPSIPTGAIILWSGASNAIPTGFVLCDGNNGTPDLRDRFIVGAGSTYSKGDTGGANSVNLNVNEIPSHSHSYVGHTYPGSGPEQNQAGSVEDRTSFNVNKTTGTTGSGQAHENRPPYYALFYIMKT